MIADLAAAAALTAAAAARTRADVRAGRHRWSPDSYDYAIRMLMRRGVAKADAMEQAHAFFVRFHVAEVYPDGFTGEPEWWALFAPRVVYPALAALLYPRRGFAALTDVAAAAHVASAPLLYRFLRRFGSRTAAAALTMWYLARPQVRDVAALGYADTTAMLLWTGVLDAMVEIARGRPRRLRFAALSAALSFTRPLPYMPLAAGAALALRGLVRRDGAQLRAGAGIAAVAVGCAAGVAAVLARAGMPPAREHFERVRAGQRAERYDGKFERLIALLGLEDEPSHSLGRWYATTVALSLATSLKHAVGSAAPVAAVPSLLRADRGDAALLLGALAGGLFGCIADPAPRTTRRTIVLPLYPVFAAGGALALTALERRLRERR